MANYEDYAKKYLSPQGKDGLEAEIEQAAEATQARKQHATENVEAGFKIPERFQGKSAEDIARSYAELEKLNSRQAQDLGAMRALVDSLAANPKPEPEAAVEKKPITADDLYDNPEEAIRQAVSSHPALTRLEELEAMLAAQKTQAALQSFAEKHPDYQDLGSDQSFRNWVATDQTRMDLFEKANNPANTDFGAADALLSLYKAEQKLTHLSGEVDRQQKMSDGMLESSGAHEPPAPKTYSRTEWLRLMTRAKQGDLEAEHYIHSHSAKYRQALASGNVRD